MSDCKSVGQAATGLNHGIRKLVAPLKAAMQIADRVLELSQEMNSVSASLDARWEAQIKLAVLARKIVKPFKEALKQVTDAPHGVTCALHSGRIRRISASCTCWKADAIAAIDAAMQAKEGQ